MRCRAAQKLLSLRQDGRLPPSRASGLEAHLARCSSCALAGERMERAWMRLESLRPIAPAPDDFLRVLETTRRAQAGWRGRIAPLLWRMPGMLRPAAALALAASVVLGVTGGAELGRAAFGRRPVAGSPEALVLTEGFGLLPFGSPAAGLDRAIAGRTEGRR